MRFSSPSSFGFPLHQQPELFLRFSFHRFSSSSQISTHTLTLALLNQNEKTKKLLAKKSTHYFSAHSSPWLPSGIYGVAPVWFIVSLSLDSQLSNVCSLWLSFSNRCYCCCCCFCCYCYCCLATTQHCHNHHLVCGEIFEQDDQQQWNNFDDTEKLLYKLANGDKVWVTLQSTVNGCSAVQAKEDDERD